METALVKNVCVTKIAFGFDNGRDCTRANSRHFDEWSKENTQKQHCLFGYQLLTTSLQHIFQLDMFQIILHIANEALNLAHLRF